MPRRTVAVVPHTHWDREWYAPFQTFRLQLVRLLDELLARLDADPSYAHFLLDGQMAAVDDVLAVRPHHEATLRRLATSGRLAMGPWYTLPDEFCVSGETLVRNLELGLARAAAFGGAMQVGYLPDMFGHVAQMPQLLRQFGFDHAVVWRGVPSAVTATGFTWVAPDGSAVRAEYLPTGYGNGADLPDDATALLARVRAWIADQHDLVGDEQPVLWMNGSDHLAPQPFLGRVLAGANDLAGDLRFEVMGLERYLRELAPAEGLATWRGELRSGARANLLMGVLSNRVDVKQAAARAERALERLAEPACALFLPAGQWPSALLDEAWLAVIRSSAHDSSCACSADEVVDEVLVRYRSATQIGEGLLGWALDAVAWRAATDGPFVLNLSARERAGLVTVTLRGPDAGSEPPGTQTVRVEPAVVELHRTTAELAPVIVERELDIHRTQRVELRVADDHVAVELHTSGVDATTRVVVADERRRLEAALARVDPGTPVAVRLHGRPSRTVLARVGPQPGFGWRPYVARPLDVPAVRLVDGSTLDNGLVRVAVDPGDGTFSIDGLAGLGRLVDGGDAGDTYNWSPPADDVVVDRPTSVVVEPVESGPVRGRLTVTSTYLWPARSDADRRYGAVPVVVTTHLDVHAGERLVRVGVSFDHQVADHRLRAHFPLPQAASSSRAECAFAVVERGLTAEGGAGEVGLPTFPSRRFVQAGGLTVVHDGLLEYELVELRDGLAHALALTLLRAVGMLSRGPMAMRPLPAGPEIATPGAQLRGPRTFRYAVALDPPGGPPLDPFALADDLLVPLVVGQGWGVRDGVEAEQALDVRGAEVSSVRRVGGALSVRVFNPTDRTATVTMPGRSGWLTDLRGRPLEAFEGSFTLAPHRIATAVLGGS